MRSLKPTLTTLLAYAALAIGGAVCLFVSFGGLTGDGISLNARGSIAFFPGVPGIVLGVGFLCLSIALFIPVVFRLLRKPSPGDGVVTVLLIVASVLLFVIAAVLKMLGIGVPGAPPLTPLRIIWALSVGGLAVYMLLRAVR